MTPKEKAKELYDKLYFRIEDETAGMFEEDVDYYTARHRAAKQCALIVVEEILNETGCGNCRQVDSHYWKQVRTEIENL